MKRTAQPTVRPHRAATAVPFRRPICGHIAAPVLAAGPGHRAPTWALAGLALALTLAGCGTVLPSWRVEQVLAVRDALPAQGSVAAALAEARRQAARHEPGLAAALYREAARGAPGDGHVLHQAGVGLAQLGQHAEALDLLSRADRLQPGQAALLNNLGYALMLSGQPEAARAPLLAALRAQPGHVQARINLDALPPVHTASGRVSAPGANDAAAAGTAATGAPMTPTVTAAALPDAMQFRAALPPGEVPALFAGPRGGTVVMAEWATPAVRADTRALPAGSAGGARSAPLTSAALASARSTAAAPTNAPAPATTPATTSPDAEGQPTAASAEALFTDSAAAFQLMGEGAMGTATASCVQVRFACAAAAAGRP